MLCVAALATPACLKIPGPESERPEVVATAPTTAAEVLKRYVAALGGEEAVTALDQRTVEARIDFTAPCDAEDPSECEEGPPPGSFLLVNTADGRMYRRIVVRPPAREGRGPANAVVTERGFDGTQGWEVQSGPPTFLSIDATADLARSREDALLRWFVDYEQRGITPELLSPRTLDGEDGTPPRTLDGVAWRADDGSISGRSYWFERRTGLLYEESDVDREDPDAIRTVRYDDFRAIDDVLVPYSIVQTTRFRPGPGEEPIEDTVRINVTRVDHAADKLPSFDIPVLPVPDPTPDPEIAALDAARAASKAATSDGAAALIWGRAAWRLAQFDEVLLATEIALRQDRKEPEALWLRARASIMRGEFKAAIKLLERARRAGVAPQQIDQQLGLIDIRQRRFKASAARFRKVGLEALSARFSSFGTTGLSQRWEGDDCVSVFEGVLNNGAMIVDAVIDDTPVRLLFDSSVASLVIDQQTAIRMLISTDASSPLGEGGLSIGHGKVEELTLGALKLRDVPVDLYPSPVLQQAIGGQEVDGIVGPRVFEQVLLHMQPAANRMELIRGDRKCRAALNARRTGEAVDFAVQDVGNMIFPGTLNGARGAYLFNSGLRGAAIAATADAYQHAGVGAPTLYGDRPGAPFVKFNTFSLGDAQLPAGSAVWGFQEQPNPDGIRIDGMFGIDAFGQRAWTIDFPNQQLFVEAPAPAKTAPPRDTEPS
jgi:hypothetical protein